jgi:hypothetical protein
LIAQRLEDHPADAAESVDSYFDSHIFYFLFIGGVNFLKPMRDFSRERPPVNEDFGNDIVKTSPPFAVNSEAIGN